MDASMNEQLVPVLFDTTRHLGPTFHPCVVRLCTLKTSSDTRGVVGASVCEQQPDDAHARCQLGARSAQEG